MWLHRSRIPFGLKFPRFLMAGLVVFSDLYLIVRRIFGRLLLFTYFRIPLRLGINSPTRRLRMIKGILVNAITEGRLRYEKLPQ